MSDGATPDPEVGIAECMGRYRHALQAVTDLSGAYLPLTHCTTCGRYRFVKVATKAGPWRATPEEALRDEAIAV